MTRNPIIALAIGASFSVVFSIGFTYVHGLKTENNKLKREIITLMVERDTAEAMKDPTKPSLTDKTHEKMKEFSIDYE